MADTATATKKDDTVYQPLTTTREERGRQIAERGGIRKVGAKYVVPSQTPGGESPTYVVDIVEETCTCPDFETRRLRCKHQEAVWFWIAWEGAQVNDPVTEPAPRKTYSQNWSAYNYAQTTEKEQVELLLKSLCEGIEEPPRKPGPGRPPLPLRDKVFASVMKVYTGMSGRRASTDIRNCAQKGHVKKAPHYNSIFRTLEDEATTDLLVRLVEESAAPLAEIENAAGQFAQDSTGFSTVTYDRWFDQKHGKLKAKHNWVKLHVMVGTATNVVTGVKVSNEGDSPLLPGLLEQTARNFDVKEVSADKAYLSKKNLEAIEAVGATPFIPFKSNSVPMSNSPHWRKMWAHFSLRSEDFLNHYHRRSNVETTMWMLKSKFGAAVRSKSQTAQVNEVLCKVICHNLACIVHAIAEFGIAGELPLPASAEVE